MYVHAHTCVHECVFLWRLGGEGLMYLTVNFKGKYEAIFIVQIIFFGLPHETF